MPKQPAPSICPSCGKPEPKKVSSFPGMLMQPSKGKATVSVYKCECGYLFAVENVESSEPGSRQE